LGVKIKSYVKSPFCFVNVRAWKTLPNSELFGPNTLHTDGFYPGHLKVMLYLTPLSKESGSLQVGQELIIDKPAGTAVIFKNSKETDLLIKQQAQEAERRSQETDRKIQATDQQIKELGKQIGRLGGAWGRFVEDLVPPACEGLFLERGIPVQRVSQRVKRYHQGDTLEIDVLVVNQGHVLAVEAKSSLSVEDVKNFIADLHRFGSFTPSTPRITSTVR